MYMDEARPMDIILLNIQRTFARFAHPNRIPRGENDNDAGTNVHLMFNKQNLHLVRFIGVTEDYIHWTVDIDFRAYDQKYHESMSFGLAEYIDDERRKRQGSPIIIDPSAVTPIPPEIEILH
jgi:hypothetical protein